MAKFGVFEIGSENSPKATFEGDYMLPTKDAVIIEIRKGGRRLSSRRRCSTACRLFHTRDPLNRL